MRPPDPFADRYTKLRLVGRGGFGVVYRAWDTEMERDIALKLLNPELAADADWRRRFRQEATAASKLNHPNITIVFDRGDYQSQPYIVMEFVEGEPLSKIIEQRLSLTDPERLFLIEQLCDGLHYAHQRSIVHRDVKPVNLVVREDHDGTSLIRTLKILDFGIAKVVNTGQTSTGGMMFTPSYVSPEQIRGAEVDRRADMFAVGAVAYELLVLRKAFDITSKNPFTFLEEVKQKIVQEPHLPMTAIRPDVDPELCAVVDRALAKAPEDRFKDLAEMRRSLHRIRERLEENAPSASQTTIVLNPRVQAVVKQARQALEADDPSAAIAYLQEALASASNKVVQRFIEQSLEEAQERQAAKRLERRARDEGAARGAIDSAKTAFARGDTTLAIRRLDEFQPAELVAEARSELARAAALVRRAERIVADGNADERAAVLQELAEFAPADLVDAPLARLRARDQLERAAAASAQAAVGSARERFAAGRRDDAIKSLEKFDEPQRVTAALNELREANAAIELASGAVHSGTRRARAEALDRLDGFPYAELVAHALTELRGVDRQMRAAEDQEQLQRRAREEEGARSAIDTAKAEFQRGDTALAIQRLDQFQPAEMVADARRDLARAAVLVTRTERVIAEGDANARQGLLRELAEFSPADLVKAPLERLRERDDLERATAARAAAAIKSAREMFAAGKRTDALRRLQEFEEPDRVTTALAELRDANGAVELALNTVRSGTGRARAEAIERLAASPHAPLLGAALAQLRTIDQQLRTAEDHEQAAAASITAAREQFQRGDRSGAITRLEKFAPPHPAVTAAVAEFRERVRQLEDEERAAIEDAAKSAIARARTRFAEGAHKEAIEGLRQFVKPALVADAVKGLETLAATVAKAEDRVRKGTPDQRRAAIEELSRVEAGDLTTGSIARLRELDAERSAEEKRREIEQRKAVEEAAKSAIERARKRFAEGHHREAIDGLRKFTTPSLVQDAVSTLELAAAAVVRTTERVRTGTPQERKAAIDELSRSGAGDLVATSMAALRQLDMARAADEKRREDERRKALEAERARIELEKEARALETRARGMFVKGNSDDALRLLTAFGAPALVAESLQTLREAAAAIETARAAVAREPAPLRRTAIEQLERRQPKDLFGHAVTELRKLDEERRAAEAEAEAARVAAAAERTSVEARQQFARGEHEAALKQLETFAPVLPPITRALEDLRREYGQIQADRAEQEKERKRLEAERAAKVREIAALIAESGKAISEKRFDDAAALLDRGAKLLPDSGDLATARTRLARAIDAEERRGRQQQVRAILGDVSAAVDRGEFTTAAEKLAEAEALDSTSTDLPPAREGVRAAQADHAQMTAALAALKEAVAAARGTTSADVRLKSLDRALAAALARQPSTRAAAAMWPEYQAALQQARGLREEAAVLEARARITSALSEGSVRKAERALREAEIAFPGAEQWKSVRAELDALRATRAAQPTLAGTTLQRLRQIPPQVALGVAAMLIVATILLIWRPWVDPAPPKPAGGGDIHLPPPTASLFEQASSRLAAGQKSEALTLALQSLRADPKHAPTIQLLARLRNDAGAAASAARDKAVTAKASSRAGFKTAEQKRADAQAITDPARTDESIRTFDEAVELYRGSETEAFSAQEFLESARQERAAGRADRAVDYALDGLKQYPGNDALSDLLRSMRTDAANRVASARAAAQKAGATEASPAFKSAREKERSASERTGPEQTPQALVALRDAEAQYRQAQKDAEDFAEEEAKRVKAESSKLREEINTGLKTAQNEYSANRFDEATKAVDGVLAKDPANARARQLQQQIRDAIKRREAESALPPIADTVSKARDQIRQKNYAAAAGSVVGVLSKAPKNPELLKVLQDALEAAENDATAEKRTADAANASGRAEYTSATSRFQSATRARESGRPEDAESAVREYATAAGLYREAAKKAKEAVPPSPPPPDSELAVKQLLDQYEAAYESLDAQRVRRFKPSFKDFPRELRSVDLAISNVRVVPAPDRQSATVNLTVQYRFRFSKGVPSEASNPPPANLVWRVQRRGEDWIIVD